MLGAAEVRQHGMGDWNGEPVEREGVCGFEKNSAVAGERAQAAGVRQHCMGVCNGEHLKRYVVSGWGERCRGAGLRQHGMGVCGVCNGGAACERVQVKESCWRLGRKVRSGGRASSSHRRLRTRHGRLQR